MVLHLRSLKTLMQFSSYKDMNHWMNDQGYIYEDAVCLSYPELHQRNGLDKFYKFAIEDCSIIAVEVYSV